MIPAIKKFFDQRISAQSDTGRTSNRLQLATAALLLEMTRVDFEVQPEELDAVANSIQSGLGLSQEDTKALLELAEQEAEQMTSYFQFTSIINKGCTLEEKTIIIEMLWKVAFADNRMDKYEEHLIRKIAGLLHVPREQIVVAKHRALRATGKEKEPW